MKTYEQIVNATCRNWKPENSPLLRAIVKDLAGFTGKLLEFGAGKYNQNVQYLLAMSFNVVGCDVGENVRPDHVTPQKGEYPVIFANRVLNVQPTIEDLEAVCAAIKAYLQVGGLFYFNIPKDPCPLGQKVVEATVYRCLNIIHSGSGANRYYVAQK